LTPLPAEIKENPGRFNLNKNWVDIIKKESQKVFSDISEGVLDA